MEGMEGKRLISGGDGGERVYNLWRDIGENRFPVQKTVIVAKCIHSFWRGYKFFVEGNGEIL